MFTLTIERLRNDSRSHATVRDDRGNVITTVCLAKLHNIDELLVLSAHVTFGDRSAIERFGMEVDRRF